MSEEGLVHVLFEYQGSKRALTLSPNLVCEAVTTELARFGKDGIVVKLSNAPSSSRDSTTGRVVYLLQKWSTTWEAYIDVERVDDIKDKDRLTAVRMPASPKKKNVVTQAIDICSKVGKPTPEHAAQLGRLFPATVEASTSKKSHLYTFDPTSESINLHQKVKKKAGIKRMRPYKLWVVVGSEVFDRVPKAAARRRMKNDGRVKHLEFRRNMSRQEVKDVLLRNFPKLHLLKPLFMKAQCDNSMFVYEVEGGDFPDGDTLASIASKESLYVVEQVASEVESSKSGSEGSSDEFEVSKPKRSRSTIFGKASKLLKKLKAPPAPPTPLPIEISSSDDELPPMEKETLEEWRRIRHKQDLEYEESLKADQEKARRIAQQEQAEESLRDLRETLMRKFCTSDACPPGAAELEGTKIAFRLPNAEIVHHTFTAGSTATDLYEYALAMGNISCLFTLQTGIPRSDIPMSSTMLQSLPVAGSLLTVELLGGDAASVLDMFGVVLEEVPISPVTSGSCAPKETSKEWPKLLLEDNLQKDHFIASYTPKVIIPAIQVNRSNVFRETLDLYANTPNLVHQLPLKVSFRGEKAVDTGGVGREFFSCFWEEAYKEAFDGASLLTPAVHAHVDSASLPQLGKVLSHGYLSCGFMPVQIAFPTLAASLLGPTIAIPLHIMVQSFKDYLSSVDRSTVQEALAFKGDSYPSELTIQLVNVMSRYGCREIPTPKNFTHLLQGIAKHEFISRPFEAITLINSGIPLEHRPFWEPKSVPQLYQLVTTLSVSPHKILAQIEEPFFNNKGEERVFGYLQQYVGNMKHDEAQRFLRFVTGSSVCLPTKITVTFNGLTGAARRPMAHTCTSDLVLPHTYMTYIDFMNEFTAVLSNDDYCWEMQSV